jgi:hypothetical protein
MYYYEGNDTSRTSTAGTNVQGSPIQEEALNDRARLLVSRFSNIGADNPAKSAYALPRSLFYDAAKMDPDVKQAEKYGLFMFYSFGDEGGNKFTDQYFNSERPEYNRRISSAQSKNPTAASLVTDTAKYSQLLGSASDTLTDVSPIMGGASAPYYWKDFIYCKYYGTIPNNRLITLRRFGSPVLDNFSVPKGVSTPENIKKGVGMPVAQAVTWFGGNSGNTLSDLIGFSTGLEWDENVQIDESRVQNAFGDNLIGSVAFKTLTDLISSVSGNPSGNGASEKTGTEEFKLGAEVLANALSSEGEELKKSKYFAAFFDAAKSDQEGRFGLMSERIWVPVDVIKSTSKRTFGLTFTWGDMNLKFSYDLTSVGEVNTKAAMFDILGNLLSIGTNYGNFLSPYIRYNSEYSALTFPGGDEGAKLAYTNLEEFVLQYATKMFLQTGNPSRGTVIGGGDITDTEINEVKTVFEAIQRDLTSTGSISDENKEKFSKYFRGLQSQLATKATEAWQAPLSLYTGAPIGEWHIVIGNPYNPIAMIGNLICKGVTIKFGNSLGPDDFPSSLEAEITVAHARPRERGEIESIFNRGDGRLYQSVKSTSANAQSYNNVVDLSGTVLNNENINILWSDPSQAPVTFPNVTPDGETIVG